MKTKQNKRKCIKMRITQAISIQEMPSYWNYWLIFKNKKTDWKGPLINYTLIWMAVKLVIQCIFISSLFTKQQIKLNFVISLELPCYKIYQTLPGLWSLICSVNKIQVLHVVVCFPNDTATVLTKINSPILTQSKPG